MNEFMQRAISLAAKAGLGECSGGCFGAVIVHHGEVIGEGYDRVLVTHDPTHHAENHAIREACKYLQTHNLSDCEMYTSVEPCLMCMEAISYAQIPVVYFASYGSDHKHVRFPVKIADLKGQDEMKKIWEIYNTNKVKQI